jgi:predicted O-methyltransferase YrrM
LHNESVTKAENRVLSVWKLKMGLSWLLASSNDRWLHPPWLYELYQKAFRSNVEQADWAEFEKRRGELERSQEVLEFQDPGSGRPCRRRVSEQAKQTLLPADACRFLSILAEHLHCSAALELGSSLGITTLYLAGNQRKVVTIEGAKPVSLMAEKNFGQFPDLNIQLLHSRFDVGLASALDRLTTDCAKGPILIWLDGHHQGEATVRYVHLILETLGPRAVFVLDDIRWSPGMYKAWKTLCQSGSWPVKIDLHRMGVLIPNPSLSPGIYTLRPPLSKMRSFR